MSKGLWHKALWVGFALAGRVLHGQERVYTDWGSFEFSPTSGYTAGIVAGRADAVFRSLESIFADMGIKAQVDPSTLALSVQRYRLTGRLKKNQRVSAYFNCGTGLTGLNADTYHVFLTLTAAVKPLEGNRARLEVNVKADAVDIPGGRSDRIPCGTSGGLEHTVVERLRVQFPDTG